ncbi:Uncharacterised protein [Streptococcus gordonii]|uniref:hypothetical protein n=1 Tax=Streptococcus gordonii TaxID=1302 RepID=UPI0007797366|nr:hypothetical protein [Streptococcus gordonii]VTT00375.1 Uncharacterised protein [Streptococcus gordonii]
MLPKKLAETPLALTTIALYDHQGQLLARFQRLISEGQEGIFIENMTEGMIFYRVCKNGKPIMIPLFYAGEKRFSIFKTTIMSSKRMR